VGRFRKIETSFKHPELKYACVGAAEGCDLLILILIFILKNQSQKIAAFGSSYSECVQPTGIGRLIDRHRWQASSHKDLDTSAIATVSDR
jgi:hypothetical protein